MQATRIVVFINVMFSGDAVPGSMSAFLLLQGLAVDFFFFPPKCMHVYTQKACYQPEASG